MPSAAALVVIGCGSGDTASSAAAALTTGEAPAPGEADGPLTDGRTESMEALLRSECEVAELDAVDRMRCRDELFARLVAELAATDPAIVAGRRDGLSDAELTPLYEARFSALRRHLLVDAVPAEEWDEVEDLRALEGNHPAPEAAADRDVDSMAIPEDVRAELERRMDTTRAESSDDRREARATEEVLP